MGPNCLPQGNASYPTPGAHWPCLARPSYLLAAKPSLLPSNCPPIHLYTPVMHGKSAILPGNRPEKPEISQKTPKIGQKWPFFRVFRPNSVIFRQIPWFFRDFVKYSVILFRIPWFLIQKPWPRGAAANRTRSWKLFLREGPIPLGPAAYTPGWWPICP